MSPSSSTTKNAHFVTILFYLIIALIIWWYADDPFVIQSCGVILGLVSFLALVPLLAKESSLGQTKDCPVAISKE